MSRNNEPVEIECVLIRDSANAFLIRGDSGEEVWVPKSECTWDKDAKIMEMPYWLAYDRGLI